MCNPRLLSSLGYEFVLILTYQIGGSRLYFLTESAFSILSLLYFRRLDILYGFMSG